MVDHGPCFPQRVLVVDDDRVLRMALSRMLAESYRWSKPADGDSRRSREVAAEPFDLVLLDIGLPGLSGLDVLARLGGDGTHPRVVMMTADDTPETPAARHPQPGLRLHRQAVSAERRFWTSRQRRWRRSEDSLAIQVLSARPDWVELLVPCSLDVADRLQNFVMRLDTELPEDVRESVGMAFRELLCNAIEWGGRARPHAARADRLPAHRSG